MTARPDQSERMRQRWTDPAWRERMALVVAERNRRLWATPEYRERMTEAVRQRWADPEWERQAALLTREGPAKRGERGT